MTGDIFLAFTQRNAGCCNSTNFARNRTQGRKWALSHKCNRKYIDTAKYDIAEEEIQFLISSKPLQTKNAHLTNRMWLDVVCTLIDNDIRHHSGQNVVDSRGAAE